MANSPPLLVIGTPPPTRGKSGTMTYNVNDLGNTPAYAGKIVSRDQFFS